ncbi:MAG: hypothetical protein ACE5K7_02710, partial [Phycisphaerae bacterium]
MAWSGKARLALVEGNGRYFAYDGRPIFLRGHSRLWPLAGWIGGGTARTDTGQHFRPEVQRTYLDEIEQVARSGGNLFRMTPFWPDAWKYGYPMPFERVEPGRFDLSKPDERFWSAMRDFLQRCAERDIIVQLEMWDRPGLSHWHESRWPAHPFNPDHNVNYGQETLPGQASADIVFGQKLFYRAIEPGRNNKLLHYQRSYVDRMLAETLDLPNVIYCIENEGCGGIGWESYWAGVVHEAARARGVRAFVTAMPLEPAEHGWRAYFDDPNFNCLDGGGTGLRYATYWREPDQASGQEGDYLRYRGDSLALIRETMAKYRLLMELQPDKARPVYVSNCFGKNRDNVWMMLVSGAAGLRYHRRTYDPAETVYSWVRALAEFLETTQMPFWRMQPLERGLAGAGYGMGNDVCAAVFLPLTRPAKLQVPPGRWRVRLFATANGQVVNE